MNSSCGSSSDLVKLSDPGVPNRHAYTTYFTLFYTELDLHPYNVKGLKLVKYPLLFKMHHFPFSSIDYIEGQTWQTSSHSKRFIESGLQRKLDILTFVEGKAHFPLQQIWKRLHFTDMHLFSFIWFNITHICRNVRSARHAGAQEYQALLQYW